MPTNPPIRGAAIKPTPVITPATTTAAPAVFEDDAHFHLRVRQRGRGRPEILIDRGLEVRWRAPQRPEQFGGRAKRHEAVDPASEHVADQQAERGADSFSARGQQVFEEVSWEEVMASDYCYAPKPEDCHDGMEPPTKPGPNGSYPVPSPGRVKMI